MELKMYSEVEAIKKEIIKAESIVILAHANEDPDALGTQFGLREALYLIGKKDVECIVNSQIEKRLDFMGNNYIVYDENLAQVNRIYDLCIVVDCGSVDRLDKRKHIFDNAKMTINIDHHYTNTKFAKINCVDANAVAAGQVLYKILKEMNINITKTVGEYIYTAIASDSGCFKYSNTKPETMKIAGELLELGVDNATITRLLFDSVELNIMRLRGYLMNNIRSYADGKITVVSSDSELLKKFGVDENDGADLVNIPRSVKNSEIAIELKIRDGKIRISLRSNGFADVSKIAMKFGGGGHIKAAGATLDEYTDMKDAEREVVRLCIEELSNHV